MITAVILCKNEEENIIDCLESVSFCDEVIVVDDLSSDRSRELAESKRAKVIKRKLNKSFSDQRNFALTLVKNEWALFVDADERVPQDLAREIKSAINTTKDGFYIRREDKLFGKTLKHGELAGKKFLRLGRPSKGSWEGTVHEEWNMENTGTLKNSIIHYPHQSISEFIAEINFYTSLRAQELYEKGIRSGFWAILFYTKGKFVDTYIVKFGFLDGMPGLVLSLMMSFHSFLTRSKLYMLSHKTK